MSRDRLWFKCKKICSVIPSIGGAQFASGGADNLVFLWKSNLPDVIEPVEADQDLPAETFNKPVRKNFIVAKQSPYDFTKTWNCLIY